MSKQLPDTPWHIGMPKMKESDHRRLNKWCVHYKESICKEPKSGCYMLKCGGSSHCRFYAESKKASEKIKRDTRTQMEIDAENRRKHIQSLKPKMQELVSSLDDRRYLLVRNLTKCYICGEKLLEFSGSRKQCTFCHMEYMDQVAWLADTRPMDGRFVYVMGREKPATATNSRKKERCRFCNNNGKCLDNNSALFRQRCDPEYCERLKKKYPDIKIAAFPHNSAYAVKNKITLIINIEITVSCKVLSFLTENIKETFTHKSHIIRPVSIFK